MLFNPRNFKHRITLRTLCMAAPVVYMIALHLTWVQGRNAKLRMAAKHFGFWTGMGITVYLAHRYDYLAKSTPTALGFFVLTTALPILGYEAMRRLAKRWFPKPETKPEQQPVSLQRTVSSVARPAIQPATPKTFRTPVQNYYPYTTPVYPYAGTYVSYPIRPW